VHLAADGSLKVLWDSERFAITFLFNKFDPPVIDGGQIYVPNYNGSLDLYRLAQLGTLNTEGVSQSWSGFLTTRKLSRNGLLGSWHRLTPLQN
jgi:outer membrane protein assembly factor BamB